MTQYIPYRFLIKRSGGSNAQEWLLTLDKYNEYLDTYRNVNIDQELRKMKQWCIDNPSKRKTAKGMPKFINTWLSRAPQRSEFMKTKERTLAEDLTDTSWFYN